MTACVLSFAIPPERLDHDASKYLQPEIGNTWPLETHEVQLNDLKPELQDPTRAAPLMTQLEQRGFAVLKNKSKAGSLETQSQWNAEYLEDTAQMIKRELGADEVFVWNSVTRSANPEKNTPYGSDHFQDKAIQGLQFGTTIRPTASGAHVDQDGPNSVRMCRGAAGADCFQRFSRVQQLNVWRPLGSEPVTCKPLAVCDGSSMSSRASSIHMGLFGTRVIVHHHAAQRWHYIKRQESDEVFILKIYDSKVLPGEAPYTPHTGVDDLRGADGQERPRESVEVRLVCCWK